MVSNNVLAQLFRAFPDAIINRNLEFVADPDRRVNSYFRLDNCETEEDVKAKCLEYLSREAFKSEHFNAAWRNAQVHSYHLSGINSFCGTDFTEDEMEDIYTHLGNCCNHQRTLAFIRSGYDMSVLTRKEI